MRKWNQESYTKLKEYLKYDIDEVYNLAAQSFVATSFKVTKFQCWDQSTMEKQLNQ